MIDEKKLLARLDLLTKEIQALSQTCAKLQAQNQALEMRMNGIKDYGGDIESLSSALVLFRDMAITAADFEPGGKYHNV